MNYQELIRLSTKGDAQALEELFELAEKVNDEGNYKAAAKIYKDSAISYRIAMYRNFTREKDAESQANRHENFLNFYRQWLEINPNGMRSLPLSSEGVTPDIIRGTVLDCFGNDHSLEGLLIFLESTLLDKGMQFYSPGGSYARVLILLLNHYFGFGYSTTGNDKYLHDSDVRVGLDLLADEIIKRVGSH